MYTIYYSILYIMMFDVYIICTYKYISSITHFKIAYTITILYKLKLVSLLINN